MSFRIDIKKTIWVEGKNLPGFDSGWGIGSGSFLNFENEDRAYAGFIERMSRLFESCWRELRK